jgi:hypothetical protein
MEKIGGCSEAHLTQSFRFGDAIAQAASQVLHTLGENKSVRGNPVITSTITPNGRADTVLARTNATVILEVLEAMNANLRACVVGGTGDLKRLLSDVYELKNNKPGTCPEFFGFQSWDEVVAFSETEEGEEIRTFVQLVQQHGESKLWAAVCSAVSEENQANIVLSTAHKAKGREWDSVRLAPDFLSSRLSGTDPNVESEVRLFYVAMTRAKRHLSVEPEMLATFSSGGWKARRPDHQQRSMNFGSETSGSRPSSPEEHRERETESRHPIIVREISSESVRRRHPGSASYSPPVTAHQSNEETIASSPAGDALASEHLESRPAPAKPHRWWQIWK